MKQFLKLADSSVTIKKESLTFKTFRHFAYFHKGYERQSNGVYPAWRSGGTDVQVNWQLFISYMLFYLLLLKKTCYQSPQKR